MIVVSNTSPIIALSRIQSLFIFEQIFGKIYITPEVLSEALPGEKKEAYTHIQNAINKYITIKNAKQSFHFKRKIHSGERSVLNLALEMQADVLIMDDRKARKEAKGMNLKAFLAYTTDILKMASNENCIFVFRNSAATKK